ncbi:30S ribosome-binding factor RbfA [uncultured Prochlorococcus sp.]|uniref:30S ribosome-binding factor RbfA n=1 Tax=uncultured Prochlorococcus sp. TaxID=159733 RepID=UPI00258AF24D|nr:30S ribosome-binding factor RbfA [uncultured Prochlorococcus sp.]
MPNNYRLAKVSSLLKKEITLILQNDVDNDLIREYFVNISKIDLSADLQHCKIYVTSTAKEKVRKEIVENLNNSKGSIRHQLGKRIEMRRVPEIIFKDDIILDKGLSVLKLLDELKIKNQEINVEENDENS